jgi:hypothetical protein
MKLWKTSIPSRNSSTRRKKVKVIEKQRQATRDQQEPILANFGRLFRSPVKSDRIASSVSDDLHMGMRNTRSSRHAAVRRPNTQHPRSLSASTAHIRNQRTNAGLRHARAKRDVQVEQILNITRSSFAKKRHIPCSAMPRSEQPCPRPDGSSEEAMSKNKG